MITYGVTVGASESFTKAPMKEIARTVMANRISGGVIMANEEITTECIGMLDDEKYRKMHDCSRRVYATNGVSPTLNTCGGEISNLKFLTSKTAICEEITQWVH